MVYETKSSRFDRSVARYYPAVYSVAARLTDDPREGGGADATGIQQRAEIIAKGA